MADDLGQPVFAGVISSTQRVILVGRIPRPAPETTMDLQTQRKLEKFFELIEVGAVRCDNHMEVLLPPLRLFVDASSPRVMLALMTLRRPSRGMACLPELLAACQPEWAHGVPVRACCPSGRPMLIASPPVESSVDDWLGCFEGMRRVLGRMAVASA